MTTIRNVLPNRRLAETFKLRHGSQNFHVTIGRAHWRGPPAEVFISGSKAGTELEGTARDGAVLLSIALQFGVPLEAIAGAILRDPDGTPSTIIGKVIEILAKAKGAACMSTHRCFWPGCELQVPLELLGCKPHWFSLPLSLRKPLWRAYRKGQETDPSLRSEEYNAALRAILEWAKARQPPQQQPLFGEG